MAIDLCLKKIKFCKKDEKPELAKAAPERTHAWYSRESRVEVVPEEESRKKHQQENTAFRLPSELLRSSRQLTPFSPPTLSKRQHTARFLLTLRYQGNSLLIPNPAPSRKLQTKRTRSKNYPKLRLQAWDKLLGEQSSVALMRAPKSRGFSWSISPLAPQARHHHRAQRPDQTFFSPAASSGGTGFSPPFLPLSLCFILSSLPGVQRGAWL